MTVKLTVGRRLTNAAWKLEGGLESDGAMVHRRAKGFTDYNTIVALLKAGWLETKYTGPRGGARYYTTKSGLAALEAAKKRVGAA